MKSKTVFSAILAMSLATSGFAVADEHGDRNDRGRSEQAQGDGHQDRRDNERRQPDRREYQGRGQDEGRHEGRGAGPYHEFYKGDRLPAENRHRQYVVDDWRGHRLSAPPRGYHWVQIGGDYVLVAIATGIIVQLLLNN